MPIDAVMLLQHKLVPDPRSALADARQPVAHTLRKRVVYLRRGQNRWHQKGVHAGRVPGGGNGGGIERWKSADAGGGGAAGRGAAAPTNA